MNELPEHEIGRVLASAVPPLREPADRLGQVRARVRRSRVQAGAAATGGVTVVAALALAVPPLLAGPDPAPQQPAGAAPELRYQGNALVVQTPQEGPRVCAAAPVQPMIGDGGGQPPCLGPPNTIANWDWSAVSAESADGATWGTYFIVGTWDGERFTLTEPPRAPDPDLEPPNAMDLTTLRSPCLEPSGGWRPADPATATEAAFQELSNWVADIPEFAGMWLDQSYLDELDPAEAEQAANDPKRYVVNMRFVGDVAAWQAQVREIWGGALCVSFADRSQSELNEIQASIDTEWPFPQTLSSSQDVVQNAVVVEVLFATPELRRTFDERYGEGAVIVNGWLEPVR